VNKTKMRGIGTSTLLVSAVTGLLGPFPAQSREVSVDLEARPQRVRPGETATLIWEARGAESCDVDGGWSGARPREGSTGTGPLWRSQTYRMTCTSGEQSAVSFVAVQVQSAPLVRWQPPARNRDGSRLENLDGYWLYWGREPGVYEGRRWIWGADRAQLRPKELPPGIYYVAITAVNEQGKESPHSNEIRIEVP